MLRTRCDFHVRVPAEEPGTYYYDPLSVGSAAHDGHLHTEYPPAVGDFIHLWDSHTQTGGCFRVLARKWLHSSYGSANWPLLEPEPRFGPLIDIIVEPAGGPFENQVLRPEDDAE